MILRRLSFASLSLAIACATSPELSVQLSSVGAPMRRIAVAVATASDSDRAFIEAWMKVAAASLTTMDVCTAFASLESLRAAEASSTIQEFRREGVDGVAFVLLQDDAPDAHYALSHEAMSVLEAQGDQTWPTIVLAMCSEWMQEGRCRYYPQTRLTVLAFDLRDSRHGWGGGAVLTESDPEIARTQIRRLLFDVLRDWVKSGVATELPLPSADLF